MSRKIFVTMYVTLLNIEGKIEHGVKAR